MSNRRLIIEAVKKFHAIKNASDAQIMTIWHSLVPEVQERYLKTMKIDKEKTENADLDTSKRKN